MLWVITSPPVPPTRVPRRLTTGRLIRLLTFSAQPTRLNLNRWLGAGDARCGDIELAAYLANASGPVPLVLDLRIAHERWGRSSDPNLNGHLHYPNDLDGPQMRLPLTKYESTALTIISVPLTLCHLCLLLLVLRAAPTVNLCAFYFYRRIGKLTAFLQLQEFSLRNQPFTIVALRSPHSSSLRSATSSPRLQHYGLTSI
jgi:hypothetical protein